MPIESILSPIFWASLGTELALSSLSLAAFLLYTRRFNSRAKTRSHGAAITASALIVIFGFILQDAIFGTGISAAGVAGCVVFGVFPGLMLGILLIATPLGRSAWSAAVLGVLVLVGDDLYRWAEHFISDSYPETTNLTLIVSISCDIWGGPIAGLLCWWIAVSSGAVKVDDKTYSEKIARPESVNIDSYDLKREIVMDPTQLLTGAIAYYWLMISWLVAAVVAGLLMATIYFTVDSAVLGHTSAWAAEAYLVVPYPLIAILSLQYISSGILRGRRPHAIVCAAVMLAYSWYTAHLLGIGAYSAERLGAAAYSLVTPAVLATLLVRSLRVQKYWHSSHDR